uniref:NLR family CARD domain containing 5 n=1 Tax=Mastacembelus armatus TaxID=205130 RepID=A0A7N8YQT9_9TELE
MDEEVDPDDENVNSVLVQEYSELFHILSSQSPTVIMELCEMMPGRNVGRPASADSPAAVTELIKAMLEYYRAASPADCADFLQRLCMLCENIPMHLESRLVSVAACADSKYQLIFTLESTRLSSNYWEQCIAAVRRLLLRRWERLSEHLVREVQLDNVWVSLRMPNRGKERPDQTPGSADRGSRTPESDGDLGSSESRVTLETFLQGCAGKVTVVVGQAGSGKTLLMSCLGQQWAHGLGPIPSTCLFILLEFRQLRLLSRPLSLSDLLFQHYLPPESGNDEKQAIVDYLLSNPEHSCWVLDGYDEFDSKLTRQEAQGEVLGPEYPLPVADLISGLVNRQLLPGCTVLVTCRLRDVMDLEGVSDKVGQLLGWDWQEIKEYVDNFFEVKGESTNRALGMQAADLLLSNRHLLAMSSLPALCNICCICLKHLLLEDKERVAVAQSREEERKPETRKQETEKGLKGVWTAEERRGSSKDLRVDGRCQIPTTLTQVYLTVLGAFLSRDSDNRGKPEKATTTRSPQRLTPLSQYRSELCELSRLAWRGLEENKMLFMEEEISQDVLELSIRTGLLLQVELRHERGMLVNAYCFIHLTMQEFLAALRIMTSNDVSDTQLKKRFSLKTRWMTKSDQRTVFTDSLHLYVCGLASSHCTPTLMQLDRASGGKGGPSWVQTRQNLVLKLLKNLCHSNSLTGPKILELCHCVQESQNKQLAKEVVSTRPILELRNIRLLPNDIDAVAFVVNSAANSGVGLDFRACSMELECLDVLPSCQYINSLSFRSRKYGDKLAEKLSSILPKFTTLSKLEFCVASLTATGAASLASALQACPGIMELNLSDNNLKDEGINHIANILNKLPKLVSVKLGQNNTSLTAVNCLIRKLASNLNIQHILADLSGGQWDVETLRTLTQFLPKFSVTKKIILNGSCSSVEGLVVLTALMSDCPSVMELHISSDPKDPIVVSIVFSGGTERPANEVSKKLCLSSCGLVPADLEKVWRSLGTSSDLTILDLSSNCLGNKSLKKLLDVLPRLRNIQEINLSNNDISMEGVAMLAGALCSHKNLTQVDISNDNQELKLFRINNSNLLPSDISTICKKLVRCHHCLELDVSHSSLNDEAIENLLKALPKMLSLQRLNVSHCIASAAEALVLVRCLMLSHRVTSVELRSQSESVIHLDRVKAEQSSCRLTHFDLSSDNLERLLKILQEGPLLSALDLSNNQLGDRGVKHVVDSLPGLKITSYVNLSSNGLSQQGLLDVASTLCMCDNVSDVEVCLGAEERCLIWLRQYGGCEKTLRFKNNLLKLEWIEDFLKLLNIGERRCTVSIEEYWIRAEEAFGLVCRCLELSANIQTIRVHHTTLHLSLMKSSVLISPLLSSSLVDCAVEGHQLAPLRSIMQSCSLLAELDFSHNILGMEGAEFLCSVLPLLPNLTSLSIGSKDRVTVNEKLSEALLECTSLQTLNLSGYEIEDTAAQVMTRMFPRLLSLNLSHCGWSAAGGLQIFQALGQCVSLEVMEPLEVNGVHLLAAMEGLTQMEEIGLDSWRMTDIEVEQLTRLLPVWTKLRKISLSKNKISDQSGDKVVEALIGCSHLEELHLSSNHLKDLTAARMALVLPSLTHIRVLDISDNSIGREGSLSLSKAIMYMKSLTKINLTSVGTSELCAVAASLAHCPLIQDMGLGWNNCGDEVALELAKIFLFCKKLTRIDLESNNVSVAGAEALAKALESCPAFQLIRLWRNKVSSTEAKRLRDKDGRMNFSST